MIGGWVGAWMDELMGGCVGGWMDGMDRQKLG